MYSKDPHSRKWHDGRKAYEFDGKYQNWLWIISKYLVFLRLCNARRTTAITAKLLSIAGDGSKIQINPILISLRTFSNFVDFIKHQWITASHTWTGTTFACISILYVVTAVALQLRLSVSEALRHTADSGRFHWIYAISCQQPQLSFHFISICFVCFFVFFFVNKSTMEYGIKHNHDLANLSVDAHIHNSESWKEVKEIKTFGLILVHSSIQCNGSMSSVCASLYDQMSLSFDGIHQFVRLSVCWYLLLYGAECPIMTTIIIRHSDQKLISTTIRHSRAK